MPLAKLTQPRSINPIPRPRLFRLLDRAGKKPVSWVWSPPGAGKTTLVASYLSTKKLRTVWYQVDAGDNDLATFFYYLGQAAPKRKRPMPLFTPEYQMGLPIFTRNFFRELFSRLKPPFALVFDNYQEIELNSPLHEPLQEGLAEIPDGGRAIFISRAEPPAGFAPLRVKQSIEIIDWADLRFTRSEVNDLVKRLAPGRWPKSAIDQLYETADGWAAALVLLMEQLRKDRQTSIAVKGKSSQVLFDYLAAEIFKRTDEQPQQVLLPTAFLPSLTARMAIELTGIETAGEVLARLHQQNYFTNRKPGIDPTYEYHPLFRVFLLREADRAYTPEQQREIRRKAADIAQATGRIETAAELYRDAEGWDKLTNLICQEAGSFLREGRVTLVESWLRMIPEQLIEGNSWLLYWRGMLCNGWDHDASRRDLNEAFKKFRERGDSTGLFLTWSAIIVTLLGGSDAAAMDKWIEGLEDLLDEFRIFPSVEVERWVAAGMLGAISVGKPRHSNAAYWCDRALELSRESGDLAAHALNAANWCAYHLTVGELSSVEPVVDEMRRLVASPTVPPIVKINASMPVIWYDALFGHSTYRTTVESAINVAVNSGIFYAARFTVLWGGLLGALGDGDNETAARWLREYQNGLQVAGPGHKGLYYASLVQFALVCGDLETASKNQARMLQFSRESGWPLEVAVANLLSILILQAADRVNDAKSYFRDVREISIQLQNSYLEFMIRTVEAHICFDNGEEEKALESLRIAMELGRKGGFVNSQVWIPKIMANLCGKALEHGIEVDYAKMLIKKRRLLPEQAPVDIEAWPWPVKIYTLGQFRVLKDDQPLTFSHKVQKNLWLCSKPLSPLAAGTFVKNPCSIYSGPTRTATRRSLL